MNILTIDVGGTHVKILASGETEPRRFASGPTLTPEEMVKGVHDLAGDWKYDAVSLGYPGPVLGNRLIEELGSEGLGQHVALAAVRRHGNKQHG